MLSSSTYRYQLETAYNQLSKWVTKHPVYRGLQFLQFTTKLNSSPLIFDSPKDLLYLISKASNYYSKQKQNKKKSNFLKISNCPDPLKFQGGSLFYGVHVCCKQTDEQKTLSGDVVLICCTELLAGFLKTGPKGSAQGNYGLMDLVAGLHWLHENLGAFGGDPDKLTLFGHGTGAALANFLAVSPMAKDVMKILQI
ncbi:hypothetical protein E2986_12480 [Frieseomelitta varia]|uniref:Carboxylesterase type B domain-containing protein n=1 Tax=Frieseomelitta varia TaxID=561572 RepID=A0A833W7P4_9HYME|nr:hypothetical protein E2986_12480 [Frieseomelitta varia]